MKTERAELLGTLIDTVEDFIAGKLGMLAMTPEDLHAMFGDENSAEDENGVCIRGDDYDFLASSFEQTLVESGLLPAASDDDSTWDQDAQDQTDASIHSDPDNTNYVDANEIVGVYPITNTGSLVVHEIDLSEQKARVSLNGQNPEWCEITEMESDQEVQFGFKWGEMFVPFSEVMKI